MARLLCLPYAGGGAAVYRDWGRSLPEIDVQAAQLPGRAWRLRDPPEVDLRRLAEGIARAFEPLADRPFSIFGHSMGAWLGMLVAHRLEARGLTPLMLLASGRQAPSLGCTQRPLRHLDDTAFVEQLSEDYGAIPPEIRNDRDLLQLLLPSVRADIEALESYVHASDAPLSCPIMALGGEHDPTVPAENLRPWVEETTGRFEVRIYPGGHFYFQENPAPLFADVRAWVAAEVDSGPDRVAVR